MKSVSVCFLVLAVLIGVISCFPPLSSNAISRRQLAPRGINSPTVSKDKIIKANAFIDNLLKSKSNNLKAFGKVKLPDQYFEFSKKILLVETHGFAKLTSGHLENLHNIKRKGDCLMTATDDAVTIVVDLGVDNIAGGYYIEVEFGVFSAASDLKVNIESIQLVVKGLQSFRQVADLDNPDEHNILNFDLGLNVQVNMGKVDIDVNIFGPMDWLFNLIAEKVVKSLKGSLQQMIKARIRNAIKGITGRVFF